MLGTKVKPLVHTAAELFAAPPHQTYAETPRIQTSKSSQQDGGPAGQTVSELPNYSTVF